MRYLVTAGLPLRRGAAEPAERLPEERFDVVRLQAARVGPLHVRANPLNATGVHRVVNELPLLEQVLQRSVVERLIDGGIEARPHLRLLAVADGIEQQVAQRLAFEHELPEHVEHLTAKRLPSLLQLLQQPPINVALAGLVRYQIPQMTDLRLADPVDTTEALLQPIRVPGQVVVDHQMGALQVDAFSRSVSRQKYLDLRIVPEGFLHRQASLAAHAAVDDDDRRLAAEQRRDALVIARGTPHLRVSRR